MSKPKIRAEPDPVEFAKDLTRWPCWPWLPLKRGSRNDTGLLHADDSGPYRVFNQNLLLVGYFPKPDEQIWATYPTLEKLFADGWRID